MTAGLPSKTTHLQEAAIPRVSSRIPSRFPSFALASKLETCFHHQGPGLRLKSMGILLGVEAVWIGTKSISVHEVTLELQVHEAVQIDPCGNDLVVHVIPRKTPVRCGWTKRDR